MEGKINVCTFCFPEYLLLKILRVGIIFVQKGKDKIKLVMLMISQL